MPDDLCRLLLRLTDQRFVGDRQYPIGEQADPMREQPILQPELVRDILPRPAPADGRGEIAAIGGQGAVLCAATHPYDLCLGHGVEQQPHDHRLAERLVDDEPVAGKAHGEHVMVVTRHVSPRVLARGMLLIGERLREARVARRNERRTHQVDLGAFGNPRMGDEDRFDQRGSRPGQPVDEDRPLTFKA